MTNPSKNRPKIMGREPAEWEEMLNRALEERDYRSLESIIQELGKELIEQQEAVRRIQDHPVLDRVLERVRRLIKTDPTELEDIEEECKKESYLWTTFQDRYRDVFIPRALLPYLRCTAVMLSPDETGVQFKGFQKFSGVHMGPNSEAVTLFYNPVNPDGNAPNFFSGYNKKDGRLTVSRAYRIDLPPGSGAECIKEHITRLCGEPRHIKQIHIDNIQNSVTYNACVDRSGSSEKWKARNNADLFKTPLGKVAAKLTALFGLNISSVQTSIDEYGFLDITFNIEQNGL